MSNTAGDFIISLAEQASVELTDAQSTAISEIAKELPDDIATQIQGGLLTVDSAIANTQVRDKIRSEVFDGVDGKLKNMAMELGLDSDFIKKIGENKETFKNISFLSSTVAKIHKEALVKAKDGAPAGDQKELQDEITKLNAQISSHNDSTVSKADHDDTVEGYEDMLKENAKAILQMKANGLFSNSNWAMDVPSEINVATAMGLFNSELASKGLSLVEDNGTLKLQTQEGKDHFVDNKPVTPKDLASSILATNKLLKVTDTKSDGTGAAPATITGADGLSSEVVGALSQLTKAAEEKQTFLEQQTI